MTYWGFAVIAYLFLALNGVVDKILLTRAVKNASAYAFWSGILAPLIFVLAPFGLTLLDTQDMLIALAGGAVFTYGTFFLYKGIQETSISRIMPIEGGLVPLFTLILAYFLLNERLPEHQLLAFAFLVAGAVLVAFRREEAVWRPKALENASLAALLFAVSFVLTKLVYDHSNFVTGLVWTRVGVFLAALSFLASRKLRNEIAGAARNTSRNNILVYYGSRGLGVFGGWLQNYAISVGSVTIVNALQGTQFAFVLLLSTLLSVYFPKILKERMNPGTLAQKLIAIVLITVGLYFLSI